MQNNINNQIQEDEIDLRELFNTIVKNKKFIIKWTIVITILAIIYAYSKTPIYEVKSNVQIGYIQKNGQNVLLDEPNTIVKELNVVFNVEDKKSLKKDEKYISSVSSINTNKKVKNFIEIKTEAISNEEALKLNKEVLSYIQNKFKNKIEQYKINKQNSINNIKIQIKNIENFEKKNIELKIAKLKEQELKKIDEKIKKMSTIIIDTLNSELSNKTNKIKLFNDIITNINFKLKDNTSAIFNATLSLDILKYQNLIITLEDRILEIKKNIYEINNITIKNLILSKKNIQNESIRKLQYSLDVSLKNKKNNLEQKIKKAKYDMSNINVQNSKLVGQYVVYDYPVKPKKKLIVIVAFITGLILSIFLVFFLEFIKATKEEKQDD